jgi:histidine triad (HIT) family protein
VPKTAVDKIFDLAEEDYQQLMSFSRRVALAMRTVISSKRIAMSVIGLEVPHAHVHLIPIEKMGDASFQNKTKVSAEEMKAIADHIAHAFDKLA